MSEADPTKTSGSQEKSADIAVRVVDEFKTVIGTVLHVEEVLPSTGEIYIRAVPGPDVDRVNGVVISPASC